MSQIILEALKTKLYAVQTAGTVYASVGGRIYQDQAPPNTALPYLRFAQTDGLVERYFGNVNAHALTVQLDLFGKSDPGWEVLGDVEQVLYDLLEEFSLTVSGYDRGLCTFQSRGARTVDEDAFVLTDTLLIEATDY